MNLHIYFLLLFFVNAIKSQHTIQEIYKYDTLINTGIKVNFKEFNASDYNSYIYNNHLYLYNIGYVEDTIRLIDLNLSDYSKEYINVYHKDLSNKIKTPFLKFFAIDSNYLVIHSSYNNLLIYDRKLNNKLIYDTLIEECHFTSGVIKNKKLFLFNSYNTHPRSCSKNFHIKILNLIDRAVLFDTFLNNPFKEFTHFSPNNLVCTSKKGELLFSNSIDPQINLIKNSGKVRAFPVQIKDWNKFNPKFLKVYNQLNIDYNPKKTIDFLSPFEDSISRIERIDFVNDSLIHLTIIPRNNKIKNRIRKHYFYKLNNEKLIPYLTEYNENKLDIDSAYTHSNYPLNSSTSKNCLFAEGYYVVIEPKSNICEFGLSQKQIDEKLSSLELPFLNYGITIFKFKDKK